MKPLILLCVLLLCGCSSAPANPGDVRLPEARLMQAPKKLADIPEHAEGNDAMWAGYGQCRVEYADLGDRHLGLIGYVKAVHKAK